MKKNAFTLIELSMVLIIIGLLVGGSFKVFKTMRDKAKVTRAQDDVQAAKNAIVGNTIKNANTLPSSSFFTQNLSPVKNNQHPLFYADDSRLESTNVCAFTTTRLKVQTPTRKINSVAFVIASESSNANMQTALKNGIVRTYNYADKVDDNTSPIDRVQNYDDTVDWVTLAELQQQSGCANHPLQILNNSLPSTDTESSIHYHATIYVDGNYSTPTIECTFSDSKFSFSDSNAKITHNATPSSTDTVKVTCTARADGRNVTKIFVITVNP
jgi:prepilin-type N-terminal cleavage/methylation domain-containing protein